MSDPERLEHELEAGFERSLLEAARAAQPPAAARRRAVQASLAALAASGTTLVAGHAAASASTLALIAKPLMIGALVGTVVAGGSVAVETIGRPRPTARIASHEPAQHPAQHLTPPRASFQAPAHSAPSSSNELAPPAPERVAPSPPRAHATESLADSLRREVSALDRARSALARGDAAGAIAALDRHAAEFRRPAFGPEARVLRIEALARLGRTDAAAQLARSFVESHPGGPLAERARRHLPRGDGR